MRRRTFRKTVNMSSIKAGDENLLALTASELLLNIGNDVNTTNNNTNANKAAGINATAEHAIVKLAQEKTAPFKKAVSSPLFPDKPLPAAPSHLAISLNAVQKPANSEKTPSTKSGANKSKKKSPRAQIVNEIQHKKVIHSVLRAMYFGFLPHNL